MPHPDRLLRTIQQAAAAFRATPGRRGRFIELSDADDVLVAGDLHGNLNNFKKILDVVKLAEHPKRHLVLQELIHTQPVLSTDLSHRLLDLVAALKCQYPGRVHVLLGNHELSQWTDRAILKQDQDLNRLFREGIAADYGQQADEIYGAYEDLFAAMPVIMRTSNRILLSHSLPGATRLDQWELAAIFEEQLRDEGIKLGGSIHAVVWGRDTLLTTAERFLQKVDADLLITGHIPCDEGFAVPNERQLILDCVGEHACCCLFPVNRPLKHAELLQHLIKLS